MQSRDQLASTIDQPMLQTLATYNSLEQLQDCSARGADHLQHCYNGCRTAFRY